MKIAVSVYRVELAVACNLVIEQEIRVGAALAEAASQNRVPALVKFREGPVQVKLAEGVHVEKAPTPIGQAIQQEISSAPVAWYQVCMGGSPTTAVAKDDQATASIRIGERENLASLARGLDCGRKIQHLF